MQLLLTPATSLSGYEPSIRNTCATKLHLNKNVTLINSFNT